MENEIAFKEQLQLDAAVMMNISEFAEEIIIDDLTIPAQFIKSSRPASGKEKLSKRGLYGDYSTLYFKTEDYTASRQRIPRQGEYCLVNGRRYEVAASEEEQGITRLELKTHRQNRLRGSENDNY